MVDLPTQEEHIILSQAYLDKLSTNWSEKMDKNNEAKLVTSLGVYWFTNKCILFKEPSKLNLISFIQKMEICKTNSKVENEITPNQVSNPDAPLLSG